MKAVLIKDHLTQTADRAQIASQVTEFPVFGGIILNLSVGGLNLFALKAALPYGIKQVWMPTLDASQFLRNREMLPGLNPYPEEAKEGISLLQPSGLPDLIPKTGYLPVRIYINYLVVPDLCDKKPESIRTDIYRRKQRHDKIL